MLGHHYGVKRLPPICSGLHMRCFDFLVVIILTTCIISTNKYKTDTPDIINLNLSQNITFLFEQSNSSIATPISHEIVQYALLG
jgi:hypothetical protein